MRIKYFFYSLVILFLMGATWKEGSAPRLFSERLALEDHPLTISAKVYSSEESESVLHTDLSARGYVPVEITIQNPGDHAYAISAASTSMSSAAPSDIAWEVTKGAIPRGVGLKVLSLFFWPFAIPSTIDSIHTFKKHKSLVHVLTAKGFKEDDEIILPYSLVKRMLYIPKETFYTTFSVALEDLTSDELVVVPVTTG